MHEVSFSQVTLADRFWSPRLELNARHTIFQQWDQLEASRCIDNFRIAAGELDSLREGWFFSDSDAYKWLDAAARIMAGKHHSIHLVELIDRFIALLGRAQTPYGYLFTYNQIFFPNVRWIALQVEHELYCHGHLIEAGVSHCQATGSEDLLRIAKKAADMLVKDFLGKGPQATCGHEEIEIALLRLYGVTGHSDYLQLARQFLEQRGRIPFFAVHLLREFNTHNRRNDRVAVLRQQYLAAHPDHPPFELPPGNPSKKPRFTTQRWYFNALRGYYAQQHAPIRRQTVPVGHSVRFGYLETAIAMLHRIQPDITLLPALERTWEHMVTRRMYVTGGVGSLPGLEGFGGDYELDPEYAYAETCAALASVFWSWQMALITRQPRYSDLLEWQLYNAAAPGLGASGETYLYNNPLACRGGITRKAWYAVPCCPSNLSRTWASLGQYVYSHDQHDLWVHQYIGSQVELELAQPVHIALDSSLPWEGNVSVSIDPGEPVEFTLHLRIPSWARWASAQVNGSPVVSPALLNGLDNTASGVDPRLARSLPVSRWWSPGDRVTIKFDLPVELRRAHRRVKGHTGKVALSRGPLVYCLESIDNPGLDLFSAVIDPASVQAEYDPGMLGGIWVLRGKTVTGEPFLAIPYFLWANRGESQMVVWLNAPY